MDNNYYNLTMKNIPDFRSLIQNALSGSSDAHYELGELYGKGKLIKANPDLSFKWYQLSAKQGNAKALLSLGWCYFLGNGTKKNKRIGAEYFLKSAQAGCPEAQQTLASFYESGIPGSLAKDRKRAYAWYSVAIKNKVAGNKASNSLGHIKSILSFSKNDTEIQEAEILAEDLYKQQKDIQKHIVQLEEIIKEAHSIFNQMKT